MDKYIMHEQIGKGTFGSVFLVLEKTTKKQRVLKRIRLARQSDWQRKASYREMRVVAKLHSPFVVPHIESWVTGGHTINMVYCFCKNGDLARTIHRAKKHGRLFPEEHLKVWLAQLLLALHHMHSKKVLHRDIKPSNIFVTAAGNLQIGDFGLADLRDGRCSACHAVVGTPQYMSPELLSKQPYGYETDVWSLGCVLLELSSLKPAFSAHDMRSLTQRIKHGQPAALPAGRYSPEWAALLANMLARTVAKRPTVQQLLTLPFLHGAVEGAIACGREELPSAELPDIQAWLRDAASPQPAPRRRSRDDCTAQATPACTRQQPMPGREPADSARDMPRSAKSPGDGAPPFAAPADGGRSVQPAAPAGLRSESLPRAEPSADVEATAQAVLASYRAVEAGDGQREAGGSGTALPCLRTGKGPDPQAALTQPPVLPPLGRVAAARQHTDTADGRRPQAADSAAPCARGPGAGSAAAEHGCGSLEDRLEVAEKRMHVCALLHARGFWKELGQVLQAAQDSASEGPAAVPATPSESAPCLRDGAACAGGGRLFEIGDVVSSKRAHRLRGTVQYYGPTAFAAGDWVGIALEQLHDAGCDGSVDGISYFRCPANCGLFVPVSHLQLSLPVSLPSSDQLS